MRFYTFGNFYLSSIQQGIQGQHAFGELYNKYNDTGTPQEDMYREFNARHKTSIYLNGGMQKNLEDLYDYFKEAHKKGYNEFPFAKFYEEKDALNGSLTSVAIILPARIYNFGEILKDSQKFSELRMEEQLNRHGFARYDFSDMNDPNTMFNNRWEYEFSKLLTTFPLAK